MIKIIQKIMYAYDDLPQNLQVFISVSFIILFWEIIL